MDYKDNLINQIETIITDKYNITPDNKMVMLEVPKNTDNGDYSTNIAMR